MNAPSHQRAGGLILLAAFVSGAVCLAYELVWSRYLTLIFGVSVYAVATVLACFMIGLALGSWHLGRRLDRTQNPVRWLLLIELAIGVALLLSPLLYQGFSGLAESLIRSLEPGGLEKHALRFGLSLLVLLVPTYLMGGTFSVLVKCLAGQSGRSGREVSWVYAMNTLGGAAGAFGTGFFLMPALGLSRTLWLAAAFSFVAAAMLAPLWRHSPERAVPSEEKNARRKMKSVSSSVTPESKTAVRLVWAVVAVSGFTSLAYEVYWTRLLTFFFKDSIYDLTIVLTAFLTGLVIGSLACGWLMRNGLNFRFALGLVQALIGLSAFTGLFLVQKFPYWINDLQTNTALVRQYGENYWAAANAIRFGCAFLLMLVPTTLFGAAFPLAGQLCAENAALPSRRIGLFYGVNTIAAALGSVMAGFVFISLLGIRNGIVLTGLLNLGAGLALLALVKKSKAWLAANGVIAALLLATLPQWDKLRFSTSFLDPSQPLDQLLSLRFYREDASGVTSVVDLKPLHRKYLVSNRLFAHNTSELGGLEDHRRLGQIPLLLHPQPQSALVVGLGAGITLRGVNDLHPASVDCVELSPGVVAAAKEQFADENQRATDNPAVKITVDDGRNFLATTATKYDVVVLDIFFPMSSGSGNAFSREYYELCRRHLRPGGIVCQWLSVHQLSPANFKTIAATFQSVFPHATLWYGMIGDSIAVVGLVGTESKLAVDEENLARRMQNPELSAELREVNLQSPALLLSHFVLGEDELAAFCGGQPLDTDDRPVIEFTAPRLAVQSARQGMMNLLELNQTVGDASQLLANSGTNNSALIEQLRRQQAGKRTIIEGFQFLLSDDPDGQRRFYQAALARDPANEDLHSVLRETADGS